MEFQAIWHSCRVRRQDHIGKIPQFALNGQRLFLEHIQTGPADLSCLQSFDQILLADNAAPGGILSKPAGGCINDSL